MRLFRYFEGLLEPTALPPQGPPPAGLGAFYWYYARQARGLVVALFVAGFIVALMDTTIPVFVGRVITLVSSHEPGSLLHDSWPPLLGMAFGGWISGVIFDVTGSYRAAFANGALWNLLNACIALALLTRVARRVAAA